MNITGEEVKAPTFCSVGLIGRLFSNCWSDQRDPSRATDKQHRTRPPRALPGAPYQTELAIRPRGTFL
jgi:hypothetical protein